MKFKWDLGFGIGIGIGIGIWDLGLGWDLGFGWDWDLGFGMGWDGIGIWDLGLWDSPNPNNMGGKYTRDYICSAVVRSEIIDCRSLHS